MPYPMERASRLGHVPVVNSAAVSDAFARWEVAQASPKDESLVLEQCHDLQELPYGDVAKNVRFAITADGSDVEVEATREHPTVKVGYLRIAASIIDLEKLERTASGEFVNPRELRDAHQHSAFDGALPGSGLVAPGMTGVDTWRKELDHLLATTKFDDASELTLADMLLALHGTPDTPATTVPLRRCPTCGARGDVMKVPKEGLLCSECGSRIYLADALRTHEEYFPEGSNQSALTRVMLVAERLTSLGYMQVLNADQHGRDVLARTIFITDGPLALYGVVAPLKRRFQDYLGMLSQGGGARSQHPMPLVVGVEKSGRFVEHAQLISHLIPEGSVMMLSRAYINRITGHPELHQYGVDEFYGRRFIYRTTNGNALVITVPPAPGISPYGDRAGEDISSYPTLRPICEVLDQVQTRLYENAVIPVALAHSAASLPLGVGQSVLRALSQRLLGLPKRAQTTQRGPFAGSM